MCSGERDQARSLVWGDDHCMTKITLGSRRISPEGEDTLSMYHGARGGQTSGPGSLTVSAMNIVGRDARIADLELDLSHKP